MASRNHPAANVPATKKNYQVIPGEMLKEIIHHSETAETVAYALFMRQRLRTFTNIQLFKFDLLKEGYKINEHDYYQLWDELEKAGMGAVVHGRTGRPDRFEWNFNMRLVAKAGLEGVDLNMNDKPGESLSPKVVAAAKAMKGKTPKASEPEPKPAPKAAAPKAAKPAAGGSMKKVYVATANGELVTLMVAPDADDNQIQEMIAKVQSMHT